MATTTVQPRAFAGYPTTAGSNKGGAYPSGTAAGDKAYAVYVSSAGQLDAAPNGWRTELQDSVGSGFFYALYARPVTSADIAAGTVAASSAALGKGVFTILPFSSPAGDVVSVQVTAKKETATSATHALAAVTPPGPGAAVTILGLKDTTAAVSGTYASPSGFGPATVFPTGGTSQVVCAVAVNTGGDVGPGTIGGGASWSVSDAAGTTPVATNAAVVITLALAAVQRPLADVAVPSGTTFVGGTTLAQVTGDDDPTTYAELPGSSGTTVETVNVNGIVPNFIQTAWSANGVATASSVAASLWLGTTKLIDLGTDSTLWPTYPTYYFPSWSTSALTPAQRAAILAAPTTLRLRCDYTVA